MNLTLPDMVQQQLTIPTVPTIPIVPTIPTVPLSPLSPLSPPSPKRSLLLESWCSTYAFCL